MSDKCGNCDCADPSQCKKKGTSYAVDIVETEKTQVETIFMEGAEDGPSAVQAAPASIAPVSIKLSQT